MKNKLILFAIIFINHLQSQNLADTIAICKNAITIELLGSSCNLLSVHYDRIIKKTSKSFYSIDVGFGYTPNITRNKLNPTSGGSIAFDWNSKLYKKNHVIGGIALAYSDGLFQYGLYEDEKKSYKVLYTSLRFGYKYQKTTKGIFLKIMATPIFKIYEFSDLPYPAKSIFPLIGFGIGYSF